MKLSFEYAEKYREETKRKLIGQLGVITPVGGWSTTRIQFAFYYYFIKLENLPYKKLKKIGLLNEF